MKPEYVLVEMFVNYLREADSCAVFPVDSERELHMSLSVIYRQFPIDGRPKNEYMAGLTDYLADLRQVDNKVRAGDYVFFRVPRLVQAPFCSLASFCGDTRDDCNHIPCHVGADISNSNNPFVIDISRPIDNFIGRFHQILTATDFKRVTCDLVRVCTQLICFTTLPKSVTSNLVRGLRMLIPLTRLLQGDYHDA